MQTRSGLPGSIEARDAGRRGIGVHAYPAHHIVAGWTNFHRLFRNIKVTQLLKLVVHIWQFALDGFWVPLAGNIQKHPPCGLP